MTVNNKLGLHARPAAELVRHAQTFRSQLWFVVDGRRFNAARLMEVLTANLEFGASFVLEAEGPDAEAAIERIEKLLLGFHDAEVRGDVT